MLNMPHDFVGRAQAFAAQNRTPERGRFAKPGPVNTDERAIATMADAMRDIAAVQGSVDEADLVTRGYTAEAIAKYGNAARDLANQAKERRI